ncbi:tubulin-folding cofactor B [Dorcoceras hygrometricum]|uniref:Tubulin-folding cofactor B n=1 Tax=Dorcoceras hygrometricum TaxID=472368 RepID=A0A2Z7AFY8_9LAMI|nr:tubulin-folding cofactor B [Dorcoceras hygrometricum]
MTSSLLQIPGDDSVVLRVTHSNMKSFSTDIRCSLQMSIEAVKEKLWKKCGTTVDSMCLELYDDSGDKVSVLGYNARPLGFYSPRDGYRLHVIDLDPSSITSGGWMDDTSLVEKYKISEEAYDKLDGTYRKFKEKLGRQHASHDTKISDCYMEDLCANIKVCDRCQVEPGEKRGVIKFVGRAETLAPGFWVGVQYDEPLGKHDGMVKGKRYFDCPSLCGAMIRPDKVKVCASINVLSNLRCSYKVNERYGAYSK